VAREEWLSSRDGGCCCLVCTWVFYNTILYLYDDDSGKNREIDILATKSDKMGFSHAGFIIECKSTTNPWVVFKSKGASSYANTLIGLNLHTDTANSAIERLLSNPNNIKWRLQKRDDFGYGLREASSGQNDSAYSICTSLIKASRSWLSSPRVANPRVAFAFPILVVDAPIFECRLNDDHQIALHEVSESMFVFSPQISGHSSCLIRIVNKSLLKQFSSYANDLAADIHEELEHELNAWATSLKRPNS
jgi:hypothetical protein